MANVFVNTNSGITPPNQVVGVVTAPNTSNNALSVTWSVPADNGTALINYIFQYREQGQSTWNTSSSPSINSTTISGLTAGVVYEIRVAANNGLLGAYSNISTAEIFDVMSMNPIAWLSSTNISAGGTEPSHNDKIGTWKDLTGAATDAIEVNTANQPTYESNVQNGLPAVNYNLDNSPFNVWSAYDDGYHSTLWENGINKYTATNNHFGQTDFLGNGVYVLGDDQTGGDRLDGWIGEFLVFDKQYPRQK